MRKLLATFAAPIAHGLRMSANLVVLKMVAVMLGPIGMGMLGNFMSLTTMVSVFAGGGIATGITKYVAEYKTRPQRLIKFLGSAFAFGFVFSAIFFLVVFIFSKQISLALFGDEGFFWLILAIGVAQIVCFFGTAVVSVANGLNRQDVFAIITLVGYTLAIPLSFALIFVNGISGAAIALLIVASAAGGPAIYFSMRSPIARVVRLKLYRGDAHRLLRYSVMALASALVFPLVEIYIRTLIIELLGHSDAGIWQAMTRLSGAYLGLFTLYLATTYMPRLSSICERALVSRVVIQCLVRMGFLFSVFAVSMYFLRDFVVTILYSSEFLGVAGLVFWYLIGDLFRLSSYVIGFLGVAKAALRLYVVCELFQAGLLIGFSYFTLRGGGKLIDIAQVYALTYFLYFVVMLFAFGQYKRGAYDFSR